MEWLIPTAGVILIISGLIIARLSNVIDHYREENQKLRCKVKELETPF